jgi:hypothetical protein
MKRFLKNLVASWTKTKGRRSATAVKRTARPGVEGLEERDVPTVFIQPHFLGEGLVSRDNAGHPFDNQHAALQSPPIYIIFADDNNYWSKNSQLVNNLFADAQGIVNSHYLDSLAQYGYHIGGAKVMGSSIVDSDHPALPDNSNLSDFMDTYLFGAANNGALARHGLSVDAAPGEYNEPIFVVVTPPSVALPVENGTTLRGFNGYLPNESYANFVWVGARNHPSGALDEGGFTEVFSHELAEVISHNVTVTIPNGVPANFGWCPVSVARRGA